MKIMPMSLAVRKFRELSFSVEAIGLEEGWIQMRIFYHILHVPSSIIFETKT